MRDLNEYILDNYNNKLGLAESYKKYSKDLLIEVLFTFNNIGGNVFCMRCDEFEQLVSEETLDELIVHLQSHQVNNPTDQNTLS